MNELSLAPGLLLSMPHLMDPNFTRAVVLMVSHDDDGSFGLIVNHESNLSVTELLQALELEWQGDPDDQVWSGGAVMPTSGWVLHSPEDDSSDYTTDLQAGLETGSTMLIAPGLALSTSPEKLKGLAATPPEKTRFLLGYSGWGAGQLAQEMTKGSWLHADVSIQSRGVH
jgi:putative transcriptional regulator